MLDSETKGLQPLTCQYMDGKTAKSQRASLHFGRNTFSLTVNGQVHVFERVSVLVSAPLGKLPRVIQLPDGASISIDDVEAFAEMTGEQRSWIHKLEMDLRWVAAAFLMLGLIAILFWKLGLPFAADKAAEMIPMSVADDLSRQSIERMDQHGFLKPSKLQGERRSAILNQTRSLQLSESDLTRVIFRSSYSLGANAFAMPGGWIVITDDLANAMSNQEVVAVLAHELGHIHFEHGKRMLMRSLGLTLISTVFFGHFDTVSTLVAAVPATLVSAQYSRDFETEADIYGVDLLRSAGLAPCLLSSALLKLENLKRPDGRSASKAAEWSASHPATESRLETIGPCINPGL